MSDSGEGRWTIQAAIDEGVPVPALSAALFERFSSRGGADFAKRLLSVMREEFWRPRRKERCVNVFVMSCRASRAGP